jgi:hypothetical protein
MAIVAPGGGADIKCLLSIAEGPTKPGTGAVVALWECRRRASVPASVEREVPREIGDELDVIDRIRIEMDTSGIRDCRNQGGRDIQVCLFEFEGFDFGSDETNCGVLGSLINAIFPVANVLPPYAPNDGYTRPVGVF